MSQLQMQIRMAKKSRLKLLPLHTRGRSSPIVIDHADYQAYADISGINQKKFEKLEKV